MFLKSSRYYGLPTVTTRDRAGREVAAVKLRPLPATAGEAYVVRGVITSYSIHYTKLYECSPKGIIGLVEEQRHDPVAIILIHKSSFPVDDGSHLSQVGIEKVEVLLRGHPLGKGGIGSNI